MKKRKISFVYNETVHIGKIFFQQYDGGLYEDIDIDYFDKLPKNKWLLVKILEEE